MKFKTQIKWTPEEITLLRNKWQTALSKQELRESFPNRTHSSLMNKARELDIRSNHKRKRKGSLEFLDTLSIESCYWWGFIMADGHITNKGELIISIHKSDESHLKILSKKLNTGIHYQPSKPNLCRVSIQDCNFGNKWLKLLEIDGPKTYFPPNLNVFFTKENLLPFLIGFIDGDGCIWESKKWLNLRIEIHGNWISKLEKISELLNQFYEIKSKTGKNKRGYAQLTINTKENLIKLRDYVKTIPYFLNRKWDKLNVLQ